MDKLDRIFELQKMFDDEVIEKRNLQNIDKETWIQKEILAIMSELNEVMGEINWKWWKNKKDVNMDNVKEEIIDVLHFFVSMCIKVGMTSDELYDIYLKKNEENFKRQHGQSLKEGYAVKDMKK